jgi:hypothetical protein
MVPGAAKAVKGQAVVNAGRLESSLYRIFQDDTLDVGGVDIMRHEEFVHTINATGTTMYRLEGDRIEFEAFFESAYLVSTETTRHIRTFNPANQIGSDIDETTTESADGWGLFAGIPRYELEGGTLRFLSPIDGSVRAVLQRASSNSE